LSKSKKRKKAQDFAELKLFPKKSVAMLKNPMFMKREKTEKTFFFYPVNPKTQMSKMTLSPRGISPRGNLLRSSYPNLEKIAK